MPPIFKLFSWEINSTTVGPCEENSYASRLYFFAIMSIYHFLCLLGSGRPKANVTMKKLRSCSQAPYWPDQPSQIRGHPSMGPQKEFQTLCLTRPSKISRSFLSCLVSLLHWLWRGLQAQSMKNLRYCRKRHQPLVSLEQALSLGPYLKLLKSIIWLRYTSVCFNHMSNYKVDNLC